MKLISPSGFKNLILFTMILMVIAFCMQCDTSKKSEVATHTYASLDSSTTYVGMQTCRECHQSIYDSFIQTGMGKSFDVASKTKSSAKFDEHQLIYDKFRNFYYKPYWENDSMKIMEFRLENSDTIYKRIETVSYIVGSGQHTNSHIMNTGGYLNQMPMTFYTQKGKWDLPPGFENGGNTRFSRLIGLECMSCHNSYPKFLAGSENKYEFVDRGIGCERCHGPGEKHVKEKKAGQVVDILSSIDYTIVNPAKLPIALRLDICQRCHIQGNAVLNEGKSFLDFRPGMRLSEVMNVFMPVYRGNENEHIMASHVERLKLSKCFIHSVEMAEKQTTHSLTPYKDALTCVTCHNPHISVKKTGSDHFNSVCGSCHQQNKNNICSEKIEIRNRSNDNCVSCHMPGSGATDIPHVSVHDHYIRIPVQEENLSRIKEFIGINCINNSTPPAASIGKAFIAYFEKFNYGKEVLDSAKKYFPDQSTEDIRKNFKELVQIAFLEGNFKKVISYTNSHGDALNTLNTKSFNNADAWASYRIGESYSEGNDFKQALKYYQRAYDLAPLHPDFANKYATTLSQNNQINEAINILEKINAGYPKFPSTLSNLGYLLLVQNKDVEKAMDYYNKALALDPDYEQAIFNKAGLLIYLGKTSEAKTMLVNFLKTHQGNQKALELLNQLQSI